jgi:hypothetical protein
MCVHGQSEDHVFIVEPSAYRTASSQQESARNFDTFSYCFERRSYRNTLQRMCIAVNITSHFKCFGRSSTEFTHFQPV